MGFFNNIGNVVNGLKDSLDPAGVFGGSRSGSDIFSTFFDPGDLTGTQASKERKRLRKEKRIIEEKRARLQAAKQVAEQVRKAAIARAQIIQAGENQGVSGSSAVAGGAGSTISQAAGNIGFVNQLQKLNQESTNRLFDINEINAQQAQTNSYVSLATTYFGGV